MILGGQLSNQNCYSRLALDVLQAIRETVSKVPYLLTTRPYPTANLLLAEMLKLHMKLSIVTLSQDLFLSSLILPLLKNFDHLERMLSRG
ncbi:hypothetical protein RYX36_025027 [Vicia faba]